MKYCLSVSDIYGTDSPKIPEGYKLTGEFRPPKAGDYAITKPGEWKGDVFLWMTNEGIIHPRLILEKLPPKPTIESIYGTKEPKIPEGYESTGELREVKDGDIYLGAKWAKGAVQTWSGPAITSSAYHRLILRKVKTYSDAEILAHILENLTEGTRYGRWEVWRNESIKSIKNRIIAHMREDGK